MEFGAKGLLSWVDGFCFLDKFGFEAYNEGEDLAGSLESYKERFGHYPASSTGDGIFGSRANREHLKEIGVRGGFKALGRGGAAAAKEGRAWYVRQHKKRASRITPGIKPAENTFRKWFFCLESASRLFQRPLGTRNFAKLILP